MKLIHIINPVKVGKSSDLFIAQPITFESMRLAKAESSEVTVLQCTTQFAEDREIIPNHLITTKNLRRSIADIDSKDLSRRLPFIRDILKRAYRMSKKGDYIIYTNVDIALRPNFYNWIVKTIESGCDAFIINRRTISAKYSHPSELPEMFEETGIKHPGYDCFVFKRDLFKKMELGRICIGAAYIGLVMFLNMKLLSRNFIEFGEEYLTFHIGDDQVWKNPENNPYAEYNRKEFARVKTKLNRKYQNVEEVIDTAFPSLKIN